MENFVTPETASVTADEDLVAGINHVATLTADLDRLERFYAIVFGAAVVRRWEVDPPHSMIRLGPSTVLHAFEQPGGVLAESPPMFSRGRLDHLGINAASRAAFERLRERLVAAGASNGVVTTFPLLSSVRFTDPDGMELEICWSSPHGETA
jgi:catechol 2,3-dioxygenase-like lactoylglutathione lyase family enzyme